MKICFISPCADVDLQMFSDKKAILAGDFENSSKRVIGKQDLPVASLPTQKIKAGELLQK